MKILIIGTGYVGLVTGACFSEMGHFVTCLDIDKEKILSLQQGVLPFYEPGLEELVARNFESDRLFFTDSYEETVKNAEICFLAVPTPSADDGSCNISYIEQAARTVGQYINNYKIIITKSTVPVGTTYRIKQIIQDELAKRKKNYQFDVVSNPEFLKEGSAVADCMKPERIIIGGENQKSFDAMRKVYNAFMIRADKIIEMDILSAEMTKYAANSMLALRISFMNEIAKICKKIGANINEVRKGIGSDSRIGSSFLYAGIGYGGSCFPKDVRALSHLAKKNGVTPLLLNAIDEVNNQQKRILAENIIDYFTKKDGIKNKTIAIWGLSFKPNTDDMREAPSLDFIKQLTERGAKLRVFDPISMDNAKKLLKNLKNIHWCADEFDAANGADAIALLTEWNQFRHLDFKPVLQKLKHKAFFDGRNQYHPEDMIKKGFHYVCIGIPDKN